MDARPFYEKLITQFPNCSKYWRLYVEHEVILLNIHPILLLLYFASDVILQYAPPSQNDAKISIIKQGELYDWQH